MYSHYSTITVMFKKPVLEDWSFVVGALSYHLTFTTDINTQTRQLFSSAYRGLSFKVRRVVHSETVFKLLLLVMPILL